MTKFHVAFLATGDELTSGDVINTNSQQLAQKITDLGLVAGTHLTVSDEQPDIMQALRYLLNTHDIIIITGGLGPTSDDRTRYAVSDVIGQELIFDENSWQAIVDKISKLDLTIHESNRQQALFPKDSLIFANPHGTAPGCQVTFNNKLIFMLPGPPRECLPMFDTQLYPILKPYGYHHKATQKKWRLFGVSEGEIAAALDQIVKKFPHCHTGYRIDFPYLEFKIYCHDDQQYHQLIQAVSPAIQRFLLSDEKLPTSHLLQQFLIEHDHHLVIQDNATGGKLQATLLCPGNHQKLSFSSSAPSDNTKLHITINGLQTYWENQQSPGYTEIDIRINGESQQSINKTLPYRQERILAYSVEYICHEIYQYLQNT